jgi:response regulator RpfG family c-di-GMP phosphodiesterase
MINPVEVLFIEVNHESLPFFIEAFNDSEFPVNIRFAESRDVGVEMILQQGDFSGMLRPDIIIFDIHILHGGAWRVLEELEGRAKSLSSDKGCIPVVFLTDVDDEKEVERYQKCPHLYISQPDTSKDYMKAVKFIEDFWVKYNEKQEN